MKHPVRKHASWMAKNDDRILEHLAGNDPSRPREIRASLATLGPNLEFRTVYLEDRLEKLAEAGLLETDGVRYSITEQGVGYLDGELDASTISPTWRHDGFDEE